MKIIGHRGARGYFPENTLRGFEETVLMGVDGIELDVICSKDEQLVVSHNPFPDHRFSSIKEKINYFNLDYSEISKVDVGIQNPDYPNQESFPAMIPLLSDSIKEIDSLIDNTSFELFVEVKHENTAFYPDVARYAQRVYEELVQVPFKGVIIVKSFSIDFVNSFSALNQDKLLVSFLIEQESLIYNFQKHLEFEPHSINVRYDLINDLTFKSLSNYLVYLWTVNDKDDFLRLKNSYQIEGFVTDYPNLFH